MGLHEPKRLNHKEMGERSEAIIIGRLVHAGYTVLKPFGENQRYDLVIEDADRNFWRVQCKTAWSSKDQKTIKFATCSNHYAYTWQKNTMTRRHYRGEVEYFAVYSPDLDKVYLIPVDHVGTTQAILRRVPAKNNQQQGVRMAQDYEL
jgi:PD-(D/E)XK endonuclease